MRDIHMIYAESAPNVSFYARLITSALLLPFNHHFPNTEFIKEHMKLTIKQVCFTLKEHPYCVCLNKIIYYDQKYSAIHRKPRD